MRQVYLNAKTQYVLMLEITLEQILKYSTPETKPRHKERLLQIYKCIYYCNNKLYNQP